MVWSLGKQGGTPSWERFSLLATPFVMIIAGYILAFRASDFHWSKLLPARFQKSLSSYIGALSIFQFDIIHSAISRLPSIPECTALIAISAYHWNSASPCKPVLSHFWNWNYWNRVDVQCASHKLYSSFLNLQDVLLVLRLGAGDAVLQVLF